MSKEHMRVIYGIWWIALAIAMMAKMPKDAVAEPFIAILMCWAGVNILKNAWHS